MAIFKCKMCGGTLDVAENMTVCQCEYCGAKQTLPRGGSDITNNLFNRANNLRMKCEYDKAQEIYEKIVSSGAEDAEAYWGLVLCKYGIEYVEDPATFNKIPTCHRTQLESVLTDIDYQAALDHADSAQKELYMAEAKEIDRLQKNILDIVHTEKPFDVFICYKESDENGRRTQDSVIANEIYHQLTQEGFKVFYAAITLEDKLGQAYEPYIFAALNSARIMLAIGTKPEYFNAVWVKNEWSRYLKIIKNDRKKLLIPCYKDMDAYDLPEEFSHLQAQDMSKIGFMNDVIRGIRKVLNTEEKPASVVRETVVTSGSSNIAPLLKRVFIFLEDGDWANANAYCEKVLDLDPECAQAYFGKFLAELRLHREEDLLNIKTEISAMDNYRKAYRFGDKILKKNLENYNRQVIYNQAVAAMQKSQSDAENFMMNDSVEELEKAIKLFESISGYKDSDEKAEECLEEVEIIQKNDTYDQAENLMLSDSVEELEQAILLFKSISGFEDADEKVVQCEARISEIEEKKKRQAELARIKEARTAKRNKIICRVFAGAAAAVIIFGIVVIVLNVFNKVIIPNNKYNKAIDLYNSGNYTEAISAFEDLNGYKYSTDYIEKCLSDIRAQLPCDTISAGWYHTVGLKSDGTIVAVGDNDDGQCFVSNWTDIIAVSTGFNHTLGLKSDGTVVAVGSNRYGECNVSKWTDIIAVSTRFDHTVGLKSDGIVVAVGDNDFGECDVSDWTDIVAVSAGYHHTVGLKSDGTVVAVGDNVFEQCNVSNWTDIVAVSAGLDHTVGLKSDGTVVAVGDNVFEQCNVSNWTDIVAVSAGSRHTVGLKADGTVVAVGNNDKRCDVSDWTDIVDVSAGLEYTVGLKSDSTVVTVGSNYNGQCDVSNWTDIKTTK